MRLSEVKNILPALESVTFQLEDGSFVPEYFHITEIGMVTRYFIDCGGTIRNEKTVNFQLWNANDFEHRLKPMKLLGIIQLSEDRLGIEDIEVEVEYQGETIGKYDLGFNGVHFILKNKSTACLASDVCGIPEKKENLSLKDSNMASRCIPNSGCC